MEKQKISSREFNRLLDNELNSMLRAYSPAQLMYGDIDVDELRREFRKDLLKKYEIA